MNSVPSANHLYPTNYQVNFDADTLKAVRRTSFHTHTNIHAERLHQASEAIMYPARINAQLLARIVEPTPGEYKDHKFYRLMIRIASFVLFLVSSPFALASAAIAFPLRAIDHHYRPAMSMINSLSPTGKTKHNLQLTEDNPFHIRTHNVGFVTTTMSTVGDLRSPIIRAQELVDNVMNDPHQPDVIMFQETFHEDATRILSNGIKSAYPYIIHSVAPQISGFNSGVMIASKYPIDTASFYRLNNMLGPEQASPRGIIRIPLESAKGPMMIYGMHTQALIGNDRANSRFLQLEDANNLMKADLKANPALMQILSGDLNTSNINAWGENNLKPKGQAEEKVMQRMKQFFVDKFKKDHDAKTGVRKPGTNSRFVASDNARMNKPNLPEPSGSWYHGPVADGSGIINKIVRAANSADARAHNQPSPDADIQVPPSTWGTADWQATQVAMTARFDYLLLQKHQGKNKLDGRVEIRRVVAPEGVQSAASDHLPVDGVFWMKR